MRMWRPGVVVGAAAALASALLAGPGAASAASARSFLSRPLDLGASSYRMYDMGAVDYNGDGILDLYTTNHTTRASLRPGDGSLEYQHDVVSTTGLDSDPRLPGVETVGAPADMSAPGLYIYRATPGVLVVNAVLGAGLDSVHTTLTFLGTAHARTTGAATATVTSGTDDQGRPTNSVEITAAADGTVRLTLGLDALALQAVVTSPADPALIRLGPNQTVPPDVNFSWLLHDRHGAAWSDVNGDGRPDLFLANGGLKDQLSTFPGVAADELFLAGPGGFESATPPEIVADHCRSRAAHWVDVDGDGILDLFMTCEDEPARLLLRDGDGSFTDVSPELPAALVGAVPFQWLDVDGDHIPELIAPTSTGIGVYARGGDGTYRREQRVGPPATYTDAALADVNNDGRPDIYFASAAGSRLLLGAAGAFRAVKPGRYGLPDAADRAAWVDANNDGRTDLFTLPGGLFLQRQTGHFGAGALLADLFPADAVNPLFEWFDGDADGDRDLVSAYELTGSYAATTTMTTNSYARGHWLELDLIGPPGNREAIGAEVQVVAGGLHSGHWVGEAEDAHSSQGQYRIYVGLGSAASTDSIEVHWPDGLVQSVPNATNTRIVVQHP